MLWSLGTYDINAYDETVYYLDSLQTTSRVDIRYVIDTEKRECEVGEAAKKTKREKLRRQHTKLKESSPTFFGVPIVHFEQLHITLAVVLTFVDKFFWVLVADFDVWVFYSRSVVVYMDCSTSLGLSFRGIFWHADLSYRWVISTLYTCQTITHKGNDRIFTFPQRVVQSPHTNVHLIATTLRHRFRNVNI
uniref:Uncharacterized protein n=1 Tax=Cucumis melo TaxID=3656 RepID=A0A9I9E5K7_CUCME